MDDPCSRCSCCIVRGRDLVQPAQQFHTLQEHFGPEYDRTVTELGSRAKGESELKAREKRVERLELIALAAVEAAGFSEAWQALQGRFVDNPRSGRSGGTAGSRIDGKARLPDG